MAQAYKVLGSTASNGTIGTGQTLYQVPASTSTVVSSIVICNQNSSSATYRIGYSTTTSFAAASYIAFGTTIAANDTHYLTFGPTLPAAGYLLFSASATTVNAIAFGCEIT
jgi:hypothetical protein